MTSQEDRTAPGLRLLSLDGGGIRGLSELIILRNIMESIGHGPQGVALPCDYFDLIGGTSTGGIIAVLLGRLRFSVDDAIVAYQRFAKHIFAEKKRSWQDGRFKASKLEEAVKDIVKKSEGNNGDERMLDWRPEARVCKTFVCAMPSLAILAAKPRLFRTYRVEQQSSNSCRIWEAVRATTAAPTFFKPITIGEGAMRETFIDAALGCNNPVKQLLEEAELLFGAQRQIACIVSLGTGHPGPVSLPSPGLVQKLVPTNVMSVLKRIATDCVSTSEEVQGRFKNAADTYFRFNVEQGLQDVMLGEWKRLEEVTQHTRSYLSGASSMSGIRSAANKLKNRIGVVCVGDINGPRPRIDVGRLKSKLSPSVSLYFTGREEFLDRMAKYFFTDESAQVSQLIRQHVFVLWGLGGSGKTQLALKFTEKFKDRFSRVIFVDASNVETAKVDLEDLATGLSADEVIAELASQKDDWLLILDNADDPEFNLQPFIPRCSHGNVIITTRNRECRSYAPTSSIEVANMEKDDAVRLLLQLAMQELSSENLEHASYIVRELGYFSLAIVQAGAYIGRSSVPLDRYLEFFRENRTTLMRERPNQRFEDYEKTVYTTWEVSFKALGADASYFLQLCSFLHFDGILEKIFENAAADLIGGSETLTASASEFLRTFIEPNGSWNGLKFLQMIDTLTSFSLVTMDGGKRSYSIHPLVHWWARDRISLMQVEKFQDDCATILASSIQWKFRTEDYLFRKMILIHVEATQARRKFNYNLSYKFSLVYSESGRWGKAEELDVQVMETSSRVLGEEHPNTLTSMANLASTYRNQGRWTQAEELEVRVMETRKRVLGEEHPNTLTSMANLASTFWNQGRWTQAEELEVRVMETRKRVLGEEHPDTLASMANLASTYRNQGRWTQAEELEVRVMETSSRVLGEEHPDTLTTMANLASTFWNQGRWTQAEELFVRVMETSSRVLGEEHPDTLTSMNNLAHTWKALDRHEDALDLMERVVIARESVLGINHPQTTSSQNTLDMWKRG